MALIHEVRSASGGGAYSDDNREVVARLQALARRAGAEGVIEAAGLRLDPITHAVSCGSSSTSLTPTEFRLLARLLARPGEAVRRRDLIRAGWPHNGRSASSTPASAA